MIKAVLFDLDGTLLPMDQEVFIKTYFGLLAKRLAVFGYEPQKLIETVVGGTKAMAQNDGKKTNEEIFWNYFASVFGEKSREDIVHFEKFYKEDFDKVQVSSGFSEKAAKVVEIVQGKGLKCVLATNPLFPRIATAKRIKWAGLNEEDFEFYTTYENSRYCKPNLKYYQEILAQIGLEADECVMVGNDVQEDMAAAQLGMKVFLLKDYIINSKSQDISNLPQGGFDELIEFLKGL